MREHTIITLRHYLAESDVQLRSIIRDLSDKAGDIHAWDNAVQKLKRYGAYLTFTTDKRIWGNINSWWVTKVFTSGPAAGRVNFSPLAPGHMETGGGASPPYRVRVDANFSWMLDQILYDNTKLTFDYITGRPK